MYEVFDPEYDYHKGHKKARLTWSSSRMSESWIRRHPFVRSALLGALRKPLMGGDEDEFRRAFLSSLRDGIGHIQEERLCIQEFVMGL